MSKIECKHGYYCSLYHTPEEVADCRMTIVYCSTDDKPGTVCEGVFRYTTNCVHQVGYDVRQYSSFESVSYAIYALKLEIEKLKGEIAKLKRGNDGHLRIFKEHH